MFVSNGDAAPPRRTSRIVRPVELAGKAASAWECSSLRLLEYCAAREMARLGARSRRCRGRLDLCATVAYKACMRFLFVGDVVGKPGRLALRRVLPRLIDHERLDLVIANGENACDGAGIDPTTFADLIDAGVHVVTSGNHIWRRKEAVELIENEPRLLRPANYPPGVPGKGWAITETANGDPVAVVSLMGRVFMDGTDCPFRAIDTLLPELHAKTRTVIVDMHAETTSEKNAMGWHLAGKVSAVLGTHTHVQTADDTILNGGTAFITDVGMCGPRDSIIGVEPQIILRKFTLQMPVKFKVAPGPALVQGAIVDVDAESGRATAIRRVREVVAL